MFPYGWEVRVGKGEIEEVGKERDTFRAKILQMEISQTVRANCCGASRGRDSSRHHRVVKGRERVIECSFVDATQDKARVRSLATGKGSYILLCEATSYGLTFGEGSGSLGCIKGDGIVRRSKDPLAGEASEKVPESSRVWG